MDLPGEGTDEKSLLDLYSEVSILEEFHGKSCVCELFDYGITHEAAFLVMKEYKCSLLVRMCFMQVLFILFNLSEKIVQLTLATMGSLIKQGNLCFMGCSPCAHKSC